MTRRLPDATVGQLAPHLAAELYAQLDQPGTRIVVVQLPAGRPATDWSGLLGLVVCSAIGVVALVAVVLTLLPVALAAAASAIVPGVGISVAINRRTPKGC